MTAPVTHLAVLLPHVFDPQSAGELVAIATLRDDRAVACWADKPLVEQRRAAEPSDTSASSA